MDTARTYLEDPGEGREGEYKASEKGKGKTEVVLGDYFEDEWLKGVEGWEEDEGFDVIYDNTVSWTSIRGSDWRESG